MASKATDRIRRIMTRLAMEGKLDKPYYPNGQRTPQSRVAHRRQEPHDPIQKEGTCRECGKRSRFASGDHGLCGSCAGKVRELQLWNAACCVGTLSRLPDGVVSCPDCPLDSD